MAFLGEKTKKAASLSETSLQCKCVFGEELKSVNRRMGKVREGKQLLQ